ncbi:MAG: dTMP kinase [Alphaproteobacteria bacterium RIFOXYD12_FULL_60_8]|nr:MAG: dTMP kinase [Alphaproteobacteria bacterium RIFOXYD12_FULL_60_8]
MTPRGRFITLEGGDGTGKSTQAVLLKAALSRLGIEAVLTREPGGSPGAEAIRTLLVSGAVDRWDGMTEALLHSAARLDHFSKTIRPALDAGRWVISDRFADSTLAYQGYGHGVPLERLNALNTVVLQGFAPDLTLVFDLAPEQGLKRAATRQGEGAEDRYERMDPSFHAKLRQGFLEIAALHPERCAVLAVEGDAEAMHARVMALVRHRLLS